MTICVDVRFPEFQGGAGGYQWASLKSKVQKSTNLFHHYRLRPQVKKEDSKFVTENISPEHSVWYSVEDRGQD
jgi:hypothetical protein